MCGHVLGVDNVPSLSSTFSWALRVSTGTSTLLSDQFTTVSSTKGRGHGRGRGRTSRGGCGSRKCDYCRRSNHTSNKCWDKFGKPEWTRLLLQTVPLVILAHMTQLLFYKLSISVLCSFRLASHLPQLPMSLPRYWYLSSF